MMAIGIMLGFKMNDNKDYSLIEEVDFVGGPRLTGRVEELIRFVETRYVDKINSEELLDEALNSVFTKLDPHSVYLSPAELSDVNDQMNGSYYGIGIETFLIRDTVNVCGVLPDSPAFKSGIRLFDKIIAIDDSIVAGKKMEFSLIRNMLRKEENEKLKLQILRDGKLSDLLLNPENIPISTVSLAFKQNDSIAYIKIDRFGSQTYKEFMEAVEQLFSVEKAKHLILDLRGNPGGYLPEATNLLCQIFEEKERLLVYTEGRNNKRNEYKSTGKRFFEINKVAVLIDENSASASEIVAGAIQDWDRGVIVGRRSFGKGLVQEQYDLNNGGAVRLTVARYYTPSGRSLQRDYIDRVAYDDDIYDRFRNGQLYYNDQPQELDSSSYITKILSRKLLASGGVFPDIFIPLDTFYKDEVFLEADAYLSEFIFDLLSKKELPLASDASAVQNAIIPDNFMPRLKKYAGISIAGKFEDFWLKSLKPAIFTNIAKFSLGKKESALVGNKYDPFIMEAISFINSEKKLTDL